MAITSAAFTAESDPGLNRSCVVEASAGTGKTTALVGRIVEAIAAGTAVETIVAVTFTHAAAGNMKLRVRHELEQRRAGELDPAVRERLGQAARSLDRAFIGTIHAFCAQLLRRRPVDARNRSMRCARPPGRWPSGATSTRPGTNAALIAMPAWIASSGRPRARSLCAIAARVARMRSTTGCVPWPNSSNAWSAPAPSAASTATWWKTKRSACRTRCAG